MRDGVRFQWLTPLAIDLSPFGTKDNNLTIGLSPFGKASFDIRRNAAQVNSQGWAGGL